MSATLLVRPSMRLAIGDMAALNFIGLVVVLILFGTAIAPFSPTEFHSDNALQPLRMTFLFDTDEFKRDVFSRVLCGARWPLLLALAAAMTDVALGTLRRGSTSSRKCRASADPWVHSVAALSSSVGRARSPRRRGPARQRRHR
ncbi:MAG: hypothetical protein ABI224_06855 [Acetobacteraceae bacterium]